MKPYYEEDGITIYHGDCREILPTLASVDHVITDPPYGIGLESHDTTGSTGRRENYQIAGDDDTAIAEHVIEWADNSALPLIVFSSPWRPFSGEWRNLIVWDKGEGVGGGGDPTVCLKRTWELIQTRRNGPVGRRCGSVWRHPPTKSEYAFHPIPKPESLMIEIVFRFTGLNDTILDPFAGSGTTLVAAKRLGRKAIGIELNETYCEIAARRLSQGALPLGEIA